MDLNLDPSLDLTLSNLTLSNLHHQQLQPGENSKIIDTCYILESSSSKEKPNNQQSQENLENPNIIESPDIPNLLASLENPIPPTPPQPGPIPVLNLALHLYNDPFEIRKVLSRSDITYGFTIRAMWWAFIFPYLHPSLASTLLTYRCIPIKVRDLDTSTDHDVILRSWTSYDRFALSGGWFDQFVERRILRTGDEVGFIWDRHDQKFLFTVLNRKDAR